MAKVNVPVGSPPFATALAREIERVFVPLVPTAPVRLASYESTALPDAGRYLGCLIWVKDLNTTAVSDGTDWFPHDLGAAL